MNHYIPAAPDWWVTTSTGRTQPVGAWAADSDGNLVPMIPDTRNGVPVLRVADGHFLRGNSAVVEYRRR